jgi:hypothetical protein
LGLRPRASILIEVASRSGPGVIPRSVDRIRGVKILVEREGHSANGIVSY